MYYKSKSYKIFEVFNFIGIGLMGLICIAPLVHILAVSFSSKEAASANLVAFLPIGFTFDSYKITLSNPAFLGSMGVSAMRTVVGTALTMLLTVLAAYPLAQEEERFRGRTIYAWMFVFTMLFSGGLIPTYIIVQKLGLINTYLALILPGAVAVFSVILLLNFFRSVPKALAEAAFIDGAGHMTTLFKVYIPISVPAIATVSLFSLVGHWNAWFDALIYITDKKMYPMATLLQLILAQIDFRELAKLESDDLQNLSDRAVKAAQIFIALVPIVAVYPFLQKYFVQGIKLGSVKE